MTHADQTHPQVVPEGRFDARWLWGTLGPFLLAALFIIVLAMGVVFASRSAWQLLGIGRGLVDPLLYPYTGLLMLLVTTFGQFIGWAGGCVLLVHVWSLVTGQAVTWRVVQLAMSVVYVGLAVVPIFVYHLLFGRPLAGLPRPGLSSWLRQYAPDAHWLVVSAHWAIDLLIVPLLLVVLGLIWYTGDRLVRQRGLQTLLVFLILLTSFVVALSLGIHSIRAHIHLGP